MEQQEQANAVQLPMTPEATSAIVAVRYAVDADFRAAFDKDPKAALSQFGGQELPSDVEIVVHRNKDKHWHIALPEVQTEGALGDEDIANVAGGLRGGSLVSALCAVGPALCGGIPGVHENSATSEGDFNMLDPLAATNMALGGAALIGAANRRGSGG